MNHLSFLRIECTRVWCTTQEDIVSFETQHGRICLSAAIFINKPIVRGTTRTGHKSAVAHGKGIPSVVFAGVRDGGQGKISIPLSIDPICHICDNIIITVVYTSIVVDCSIV